MPSYAIQNINQTVAAKGRVSVFKNGRFEFESSKKKYICDKEVEEVWQGVHGIAFLKKRVGLKVVC